MTKETIDESLICDSEAARLLPWFVTGRLAGGDSARVSQHLERCALCRADLDEQRRLRAALRTEGTVEFAPQAGLAATLARIDELDRPGSSLRRSGAADGAPGRARRIVVSQWLTAAVLVQAVGLGVLSAALVERRPAAGLAPAVYRTRSAPEAARSTPLIRAVFSRSITLGDLELLLSERRLVIISGPSPSGVFTLGAADHPAAAMDLSRTAAELRQNRYVQFAEPIAGAERAPP